MSTIFAGFFGSASGWKTGRVFAGQQCDVSRHSRHFAFQRCVQHRADVEYGTFVNGSIVDDIDLSICENCRKRTGRGRRAIRHRHQELLQSQSADIVQRRHIFAKHASVFFVLVYFKHFFYWNISISVSTFTKGEQMVPVLNDVGVHCSVFGNHDFGDYIYMCSLFDPSYNSYISIFL